MLKLGGFYALAEGLTVTMAKTAINKQTKKKQKKGGGTAQPGKQTN